MSASTHLLTGCSLLTGPAFPCPPGAFGKPPPAPTPAPQTPPRVTCVAPRPALPVQDAWDVGFDEVAAVLGRDRASSVAACWFSTSQSPSSSCHSLQSAFGLVFASVDQSSRQTCGRGVVGMGSAEEGQGGAIHALCSATMRQKGRVRAGERERERE